MLSVSGIQGWESLQGWETIDDRAYQRLDKRGTQDPVPQDLKCCINDSQYRALMNLESFGWQLAFIRRPLFEPATVVILSPEGKQFAVIEDDGGLNLAPSIPLRRPYVATEL